jgi:hypothetical protein
MKTLKCYSALLAIPLMAFMSLQAHAAPITSISVHSSTKVNVKITLGAGTATFTITNANSDLTDNSNNVVATNVPTTITGFTGSYLAVAVNNSAAGFTLNSSGSQTLSPTLGQGGGSAGFSLSGNNANIANMNLTLSVNGTLLNTSNSTAFDFSAFNNGLNRSFVLTLQETKPGVSGLSAFDFVKFLNGTLKYTSGPNKGKIVTTINTTGSITESATPIPEPASLTLASIAGLGGLGFAGRRMFRQAI